MLAIDVERDPCDDGEPILVCCVACEMPVGVMFAEYDMACEVWLCHECLFHCDECEADSDEELAAEPAS